MDLGRPCARITPLVAVAIGWRWSAMVSHVRARLQSSVRPRRDVSWFRRRIGMAVPDDRHAVSILSGALHLLWGVVVSSQSSIERALSPCSRRRRPWALAALKLVGMLLFPANVLAAALFPPFALHCSGIW